MIPISDRVPIHKLPIITYSLISCIIALFIWEIWLYLEGKLEAFITDFGVIPARISNSFSAAIAFDNPAAWVALFLGLISLITALFIHSSFAQILGNLIFLFVFGKAVENRLGKKFLLLYILGGILTELIQILINPNQPQPLIGSTVAIATILGAYIIAFPKAKIEAILTLFIVFIPLKLPAFFFLFWWIIQQLFYGIGELSAVSKVNLEASNFLIQVAGILIGAAMMRGLNCLKKE